MKRSTQPQIIVSPIPKQLVTEEDDDLRNPMLDSFSQKSQSSEPGPAKQMKLVLIQNKSDLRKDPFRYNYSIRKINSESKKISCQNKYKQMDSLLPLLKLVQLNQRQNKTECFNGEEVTIEQKVYFKNSNEILNIFQKAADGVTIIFEETDDVQGKQMKKSVPISEKMIKSMKAINTFKKAKYKLRSFILPQESSKQTEQQIIYKLQVENFKSFIHENTNIKKSDHQLGGQIIKTKPQTQKKDQIDQSQKIIQEKKENNKVPKQFFLFIKNSKIILKKILFIIAVFLIIFVMAYIKTLNSVTIHIEDL